MCVCVCVCISMNLPVCLKTGLVGCACSFDAYTLSSGVVPNNLQHPPITPGTHPIHTPLPPRYTPQHHINKSPLPPPPSLTPSKKTTKPNAHPSPPTNINHPQHIPGPQHTLKPESGTMQFLQVTVGAWGGRQYTQSRRFTKQGHWGD